jgi:phage/plasmid primase-like uncharacterized protein
MSEPLRDWIDRARLADIESTAHGLGLRLTRSCGELVGPCPRCGGVDRFVVSPRKQLFRCRKCQVAGDAIALVAHVEGLDSSRPADFFRAVQLVTGEPPPGADAKPDPEREARLAEQRARAEHDMAAREAEQRELERRRHGWAMRIWRESEPAAGTLVEDYLRARSIEVEPPPTLRFHPALPHRPSGASWPAMVALVTRDRAMLGVHRTWIARDGSDKAPVEKPKMALGPIRGGAVRLAPAAITLLVTEGIETGLSVMQATGTPTWAALGTSGLKALVLPPEVTKVTVCADRDPDGAGMHAAEEAAQRWLAEGREARFCQPPPGYGDFNDMAMEEDAP